MTSMLLTDRYGFAASGAAPPSAVVRGELLAYSLCPWQIPQCTMDVKAAIYKRRGWQ